jgi:ABC-2 type transport system permease protein
MTTASVPVPAPPSRAEAPPISTPAQVARAFRRLRLRLAKNLARSILSGSRLRMLMILFCSAVFWTGLFGLFFKGFQFIGIYVELVNTIVE